MESKSMIELLQIIGWSKRAFAIRMEVSEPTVYRWVKNEPEYVMKYLRMVARLIWLAKKLQHAADLIRQGKDLINEVKMEIDDEFKKKQLDLLEAKCPNNKLN